jgi:hypothetical protein
MASPSSKNTIGLISNLQHEKTDDREYMLLTVDDLIGGFKSLD